MKYFATAIAAILFAALSAAAATPALAEASATGARVGGFTLVQYAKEHSFHTYLSNHPKVAAELKKNPSLANDPAFLKNHPGLRQTINSHPGLRRQLRADPQKVMERYRYRERYRQHQGAGPMGPGAGGAMGPMGPGGGMGMGPRGGGMGSGGGAMGPGPMGR